MNKIISLCLTLYLSFFLNGCTSPYKRVSYFISDLEKQEIIALIENQSEDLKHTILKEVDSSFYGDKKQIKHSAKELLFSFLMTTTKNKLLADEKFESVHNVVGNRNLKVREAFALTFSKYLTDKAYHCKQPLYFQYYKNRYGSNGTDTPCQNKIPFNVLSKDNVEEVTWLDPMRVKSIHLLFAGNGESIASRFGHISIRLIICPKNNFSKEACDSNLYEHLVLGYRAHINEFKISTLKGLMGDYRSYLFANNFMDVYQEYAIGEFREIYSLPLKLNKYEREKTVRTMSEIHWGYTGDYKYLTKNCSNLMQNALKHTWKQFSLDPKMNELYWRPDNFFEEMKSSALTKFEKLSDLVKAEQEGYYFSSTKPIYEKALNLVRDAMHSPSFSNLDEYLIIDPAKRHSTVLDDDSFYATIKDNKYLLEAQLLLEELSIIRFENRMMAEMAFYFDNNDIDSIKTHMRNQLKDDEFKVFSKCILAPVVALTKPLKKKSGIPVMTDIDLVKSKRYSCKSAENKVHLKRVRLEMHNLDPDNWAPIEAAMYYWVKSLENVGHYIALQKNQLDVKRLN